MCIRDRVVGALASDVFAEHEMRCGVCTTGLVKRPNRVRSDMCRGDNSQGAGVQSVGACIAGSDKAPDIQAKGWVIDKDVATVL